MRTYRIQNIIQHRKVQLLTFMFSESKISKNIKTDRPNMVLRSDTKVKYLEKFTRKTTGLNSPIYRGYALWNELPEELQKIDSLLVFKRKLKERFYIG